MLEDTIEILTKQMIEEHMKKEEKVIHIKKVDLYRFCIKLVKLVKEVYES